jgi:hypothetical protein
MHPLIVDFMRSGIRFAAFAAAAIALGLGGTAPAQEESEIQKQLEALKKGQEEIRQELDEIKKLLQARPPMAQPVVQPPQPNVKDVSFDISGNPVKGASSASLILIEFTDYQ